MMWIQHAVALAAVGGCVAFLGRCAFKSLTGGKCASGCGGCSSNRKKPAPVGGGGQTVFIPVEMLSRKK